MIRLATWNYQKIYEEGAIENKTRKYHTYILVIQETNLTGNNMTEIEN